jgi:hypothetical protein
VCRDNISQIEKEEPWKLLPIGDRIVNESLLKKFMDETKRTQLQMLAISTKAMKGAGNLREEVVSRRGYADVPSTRTSKFGFVYCFWCLSFVFFSASERVQSNCRF